MDKKVYSAAQDGCTLTTVCVRPTRCAFLILFADTRIGDADICALCRLTHHRMPDAEWHACARRIRPLLPSCRRSTPSAQGTTRREEVASAKRSTRAAWRRRSGSCMRTERGEFHRDEMALVKETGRFFCACGMCVFRTLLPRTPFERVHVCTLCRLTTRLLACLMRSEMRAVNVVGTRMLRKQWVLSFALACAGRQGCRRDRVAAAVGRRCVP